MTKLKYTKGVDDASGMDVTMVNDWISVDDNWHKKAEEVINQLLNERPELHIMNVADYCEDNFRLTGDPMNDMFRYFDQMINELYGRVHKVCVMIEDETDTIMIGDSDTCWFD